MKTKLSISLLLLLLTFCLFAGCEPMDHHEEHGDEHAEEEGERGEHGGRLLSKGNLAVELQIFEDGVDPQYRIYAFKNGKQISVKEYSASVRLKRLGGKIDEFNFKPAGDFLLGDKEVQEPHSFDVEVSAEYGDKKYSWEYASHEGRVAIEDEVAKHSGIETEKAMPRLMRTILKTRGKVLPSEHKIAHIIPRFAGIVREGGKHIGDRVEAGEVLAIIESNESLQPFEVSSQIPGTIINGHLIVGEFVPENQWVYIVADLSEVWADFFVPLSQRQSVQRGQKVEIYSLDNLESVEGKVSYIAPYADEKSQSQLIRVIVPNEKQAFLPGMFVTSELVIEESEAAVVVKKKALQTFRDWQVVFMKVGETYEIRPLTVGRSDGEYAEVLEGLSVGEEYVTENSFLIKADILKSGASHDH